MTHALRVRSRSHRPVHLAALVLLSACASDPRAGEREFLAAYDARHRAALEDFQREQQAFPGRVSVPRETEFEGLGTLVLTGRELLGRPGQAFVRVRFTYVNTTRHAHEDLRASLYLNDPETGESFGESLAMRMPYRTSLTPGSSYTSWLDVPTRGVERKPGWTWDLVLESGG